MSVRKARALSRATSSRVIVILRNQYLAIPATKSRIGARERAERLGNTRIVTQVQRSGGHVYRTYHALNAFAATVSKNERTALQRDAAVKQVIPDTIVQLPAPINARSIASTKSPRAGAHDAQRPDHLPERPEQAAARARGAADHAHRVRRPQHAPGGEPRRRLGREGGDVRRRP